MEKRAWLRVVGLLAAFILFSGLPWCLVCLYAVELGKLQLCQAQLHVAEAELGKVRQAGSETQRRLQDTVEAPFPGAECLQWTEQDWGPWRLTDFSEGDCEQPTNDCIQTVGYPSGYPDSAACGIQFAPSTTGSGLVLKPEGFDLESGYDFLVVDGEVFSGTSIFKPFEVTRNTTVDFTSDYCCAGGGWRLCLRAVCANYTCPAGYERNPNAEYLACSNLTCSENDLDTCCVSLASAACVAPEGLGLGYEVPSTCAEGNLYTFASGACQLDCAAGYALNGFGAIQECDEVTQNFTAPDCQEVLPDAAGGSFSWRLSASSALDCYEYGPSCVASVGFQSEGYASEASCTARPTSAHWPLTDYRLYVAYLSTEEVYDKLVLVDYYSWDYYYYYDTVEVSGEGVTMGPYNIGRVFWSSDLSVNDRGWLVCAQAKCNTMTCPIGYIFDCNAKDEYCTGTCDTWSDVDICCKNETVEELAGILEPGEGRNVTSALCFTTTSTTPHSYQSPSWTGEMQVAAVENVTVDGLEQALRDGLASLGNVSALRVWVWLVGPGLNDTFQVGWIVEQTEVDLASMPDDMLLDAFNTNGEGRRLNDSINASVGWLKDILSRTTAERPAADRQTSDGYYAFPGYCQDRYPCSEDDGCWRDETTQKTCGQLHAEAVCANPPSLHQGGPGFDDWAAAADWSTGFYNWIWYDSKDPNFRYPNYANQVCCTCGGGQCQAGSYLMTQSGGSVNSPFCAPCPSGTSSESGVSCTACPTGTYSGVGAAECIACDPGKYAAEEGMSTCLACDPGFVAERGR
ncbi:hypothetical protein ACP0BX_000467 [Amphidinium carterae]